MRAPANVAETIDGGDFTLKRQPSGRWVLKWQWAASAPQNLFKGVTLYRGKLKNEEQREWFNAEVGRWIESKFLERYCQKYFGTVKCILTWNPVIQLHKTTKVRPALDYSILNPYIKNTNFVSQSEVCHISLQRWRKLAVAYLVDVDKAYMNVEVDRSLYPYQVVEVDGAQYAMTRMGFGLNVAPRVLKCLIQQVLKEAKLDDVTNPYRDDVVVGSEHETARAQILQQVDQVREALLKHGLPTKQPVNLYDFSNGPTKALGLELFNRNGYICWRRRSDSDWRLGKKNPSLRDLASFVGRACPGHYPVLGHLRPASLQILSGIGKEAHQQGWSGTPSAELVDRSRDLEALIESEDPTTGRWKIPARAKWVLSTDASTQALGCALTTASLWEHQPDAGCPALEDHCWLVKNRETHINVLELDAVIKSINSVTGYLKPGDSLTLVNDNRVCAAWLQRALNDEKIETSGLYEILIKRRLDIFTNLVEDYRVTVQWVPTDRNPADRLTRVPHNWTTAAISAAILTGFDDDFVRRVASAQQYDQLCIDYIMKLDEQQLITIRQDAVYKKHSIDRTSILQLILPDEMLEDAVKQVHVELGHAGWKPVWIDMKKRFCLPSGNMASKVQKILRSCIICAYKNAKPVTTSPDQHSERLAPWYEVFVDTLQVGSLSEPPPHTLLVAIDNFSKFTEAIPLWSKTGEQTAGAMESILCRYGGTKVVRCDNGTEFENAVFENTVTRQGAVCHFGSIRNPQAQATVERVHRTLLDIIRSMLFGTDIHWTYVLNAALDCYRARPHSSLVNRSPREILLGVPSAQLDGEFDREVYWADSYDLIDSQEQQITTASAERWAFAPGERVLVKADSRRRIKLTYGWTPATVVKPTGRGAYVVQDDRGRPAVFHERNLSKMGIPMEVPREEQIEDVPAPPSTVVDVATQPTEQQTTAITTRSGRVQRKPNRLIENC
jgi:hypothetical protein